MSACTWSSPTQAWCPTDPGPTPGDRTAFDVADRLQAAWLVDIAKVVTALGSAAVNLPLIAVGGFASGHPAAVGGGGRPGRGHADHLRGRRRAEGGDGPPAALGGARRRAGLSFPSGHAAHSIIFPWLALTLTIRLRPGMAGSSALLVLGFVLAAAVGLSRVYLHVHYLSDVTGGWALGTAAFAACGVVAMLVLHLRQNGSGVAPLVGIGTEYYLFAGAGPICVLAFAALILGPPSAPTAGPGRRPPLRCCRCSCSWPSC